MREGGNADRATAASHHFNFPVKRAVKYLGVVISSDLTSDAHVEKYSGPAFGELNAARSASAIVGGLNRIYALVGYVSYGRAYIEWAAAVFGPLSSGYLRKLRQLYHYALFLVTGVKNDFIAGRLVGELPDDVRRLMLRARFAFDLVATAEIFPERKLLYKAFDYLTLPLAPAIHQAAESLRIGKYHQWMNKQRINR